MSESEFILTMEGVCKSFPGVKALDHVSLHLRPASCMALMGENGAGKSTLMKCLFGIYKMDEGEVFYNGEPLHVTGPLDAMDKGLAMVHQELQPIAERSIAENIFCNRYPTKKYGPISVVDHKTMIEESQRYLDELGLEFDASKPLKSLTASQMQLVEIAKAVGANAKVIILDEPTSSLTNREVENLFNIIRKMKERGCSVVYISHRMDEILEISDYITIMRDGHYIGEWPTTGLTRDEIIAKQVGREMSDLYPKKTNVPGEVIFEAKNFTSPLPRSFKDCNFSVRKGEVFGIGGLIGAQRTELMEAIFGLRSKTPESKIIWKGKEVTINNPKDAIGESIALITEDRRGTGIFGVLSIEDNTSIASVNDLTKSGIPFMLDNKKLKEVVSENVKKLSVKTPNLKTLISSLSGGNQQKVIIARWLAKEPDLLIMDEPTRGIDVLAKYEIYSIINELVTAGKTIIMISSEMPELIGVADRIMVMYEGEITGIVEGEDMNQEKIMALATGHTANFVSDDAVTE